MFQEGSQQFPTAERSIKVRTDVLIDFNNKAFYSELC